MIDDVKENVLQNLEAAFCESVQDIDGQSWEDVVDASTSFLLRTVLAKTEKDKLRAPHTSFEEIKDIGKVEKHISQVLERVAKKDALLETHFGMEEEAKETISGEFIRFFRILCPVWYVCRGKCGGNFYALGQSNWTSKFKGFVG